MIRRGVVVLALLTVPACAPEPAAEAPADAVCGRPTGDSPRATVDGEPCETLAGWNVVRRDGDRIVPIAATTVPYDLATPLFTDYAIKFRTVTLPEGAKAVWHDEDAFDFPVGTIISKTFAFPADLRRPDQDLRILETRLLARTSSGWQAWPYLWNEAGTEARLHKIGAALPVTFVDAAGATRTTNYLMPNVNQCKGCHANLERNPADVAEGPDNRNVLLPIGPRARHLNRDYDYGDGVRNQLAEWTARGILEGAPATLDSAPRLVDWSDAAGSTLDARARSYLDANCAHCHNPRGPARVSGLFLAATVTEPARYGVCKSLVAAGRGGLGKTWDIVPGQPDESVLLLRMDSLEPDVMMPELGRTLVHAEAVALIREWIADNPWSALWPEGCTAATP